MEITENNQKQLQEKEKMKTCDETDRGVLVDKVARAMLNHHGSTHGEAGKCQICKITLDHSHAIIDHTDGSVHQIKAHGMSHEQVLRGAKESGRRNVWVIPIMACNRASRAAESASADKRLAYLKKERRELYEARHKSQDPVAGETF